MGNIPTIKPIYLIICIGLCLVAVVILGMNQFFKIPEMEQKLTEKK